MGFYKRIDLTPPSRNKVAEFRRLAGILTEEVDMDAEELDIADEQLDPDDQIDPDDEAARDEAEKKLKAVKEYPMYGGKTVYDGQKTGGSKKKKKTK